MTKGEVEGSEMHAERDIQVNADPSKVLQNKCSVTRYIHVNKLLPEKMRLPKGLRTVDCSVWLVRTPFIIMV